MNKTSSLFLCLVSGLLVLLVGCGGCGREVVEIEKEELDALTKAKREAEVEKGVAAVLAPLNQEKDELRKAQNELELEKRVKERLDIEVGKLTKERESLRISQETLSKTRDSLKKEQDDLEKKKKEFGKQEENFKEAVEIEKKEFQKIADQSLTSVKTALARIEIAERIVDELNAKEESLAGEKERRRQEETIARQRQVLDAVRKRDEAHIRAAQEWMDRIGGGPPRR